MYVFFSLQVDGQLLNLPIELDDGKVSVVQRGRGAEVQTDFGLLVYYDWNWHLVIKLPSSYHGRVCGLCGNFNRKRNDERLNPAGKPVSSVIEWGKSWQTADQDKNSPCSVCEKDCPSCDKSRLQRYQTQAFCGALTDKRGSFKQCHKKVDPKPFFHSCVFDICMNDGDKKMLCQALASYVSQCNDQGVKIKGWRRKYGCREYFQKYFFIVYLELYLDFICVFIFVFVSFVISNELSTSQPLQGMCQPVPALVSLP